jgi:hypothetical protein
MKERGKLEKRGVPPLLNTPSECGEFLPFMLGKRGGVNRRAKPWMMRGRLGWEKITTGGRGEAGKPEIYE